MTKSKIFAPRKLIYDKGVTRVIDPQTGEVLEEIEGHPTLVLARRRHKRNNNFVVFYQTDLLTLCGRSLGRRTMQVLLSIIGHMDFENIFRGTQVFIAQQCGIAQPRTNEIFQQLLQSRLLSKGVDETGRSCYLVDHSVCWKGSLATLRTKLGSAACGTDIIPGSGDKTDQEGIV